MDLVRTKHGAEKRAGRESYRDRETRLEIEQLGGENRSNDLFELVRPCLSSCASQYKVNATAAAIHKNANVNTRYS